MIRLTLVLLLLLATAPACQSVPKQDSQAPDPSAHIRFFTAEKNSEKKAVPNGASDSEAIAHQLTFVGENGEATFSPDGKRVLYHSKARPQHANTQVYEMDLATRKERRVTFHDGDDAHARYHPDGARFLYASTTDEIKEDPNFIHELMKNLLPGWAPPGNTQTGEAALANFLARFPRHELYLSNLNGSDIIRLTENPGYDAEAAFDPNGRRFVFSSIRGGKPDLYSMTVTGQLIGPLTRDPEYDSRPSFAADGWTLAWARFSKDYKTSQIYVADAATMRATPITMKAAIHWSPYWHPNGQEIIFSSNIADPNQFDLYAIDRKGLCLRRLTNAPGDETLPAFSPDGRQVLFTSNISGRHQIYLMEYRPPHDCLENRP